MTRLDRRRFLEAVAAAGVGPAKIVVCAGTYNETFSISGADKITLMGKKGAILVPPSASYNGALITVSFSTNITIQGLVDMRIHEKRASRGIQ